MTNMNLVIVESAAKAKTIEKYLNSIQELKRLGSFKVIASFGHIRDLPEKTIGINISTWIPDYQNMKTKGDIIKKLKQATKEAKFVYLASDMDLEGESIAMHLKTVLNLTPNGYKRIKFNEITKNALKNAFQNAGDIDMNMFAAQETRRIIDRVVGYELSPLLWRRFMQKSLSAGRVQSVTLQMIRARYNTVVNHVPEIYWICEGTFIFNYKEKVNADIQLDATVYTTKPDNQIMHWKADADIQSFLKLLIQLNNDQNWKITFTQKKVYKKPSAPFTTSTLQQEVYNRYHITPKTTMRSAQALYEAGFITYMRTDSVVIADDAQKAILEYNIDKYGIDNTTSRTYKTKQENAQEAHECIRPTHPETLSTNLPDTFTDIDRKIYNLIWRQTIASQMASAEYNEVSYIIKIPNINEFYFYGKKLILTKEGYLLVYSPDIKVDSTEIKLWEKILKNPETCVKLDSLNGTPNITKPNSLFNESSIVKALEKEGIGRPSTYASIIDKLFSRAYIEKGESPKKKVTANIYEWNSNDSNESSNSKLLTKNKELQTSGSEKDCLLPTSLGERIVEYLYEYVPFLLNKEFTRHMESDLDKIMVGETNKVSILNDFYSIFHGAIEKANKTMSEINKNNKDPSNKATKMSSKEGKSSLKPKEESVLYKITEDYIIVKTKYGPALLKQSESKWYSIKPFIEWKNKTYEDITEEDITFIISLPRQIPNTDRSLYLGPYGLYIKDAQHNYILPKEQWDNAYNNRLDSEYIKNLPPFQPKPKKQYSASAKKK